MRKLPALLLAGALVCVGGCGEDVGVSTPRPVNNPDAPRPGIGGREGPTNVTPGGGALPGAQHPAPGAQNAPPQRKYTEDALQRPQK